MKHFFTIFLGTVFLLLAVASAAVLGFLYFDTRGKLDSTNLLLSKTQGEYQQLQTRTVSFNDPGLGIEFEMPTDWDIFVESELKAGIADTTNDFIGSGLKNYKLNLQKGDMEFSFYKVLVATGTIPTALSSTTTESKVLSTKLVRYREKAAQGAWRYASKVDCKTLEEPPTDTNAVCIAEFFPVGGLIVSFDEGKSAKPSDLDVADKIALSAIE